MRRCCSLRLCFPLSEEIVIWGKVTSRVQSGLLRTKRLFRSLADWHLVFIYLKVKDDVYSYVLYLEHRVSDHSIQRIFQMQELSIVLQFDDCPWSRNSVTYAAILAKIEIRSASSDIRGNFCSSNSFFLRISSTVFVNIHLPTGRSV